MDRPVVYVGELPRSSDFLGLAKDALYSVGDVLATVLGTSTCANGLACSPTIPASLSVTIGQGAIYSQQTVDASAYGGLGIDSNTIVKQGLLTGPATLTITPPSTTGYSQVYLVQAAYNDTDGNAVILPYYNSANPAQPLNGPGGSNTPQFTVRAGLCTIQLKAGAAAPTGSQVAPVVSAGFTALYQITVSNGQTQITSGNIALAPGAPFVPLTLNSAPVAIQQQPANYALDTGSANAMAITLPAYTALVAGTPLRIKKGASANGAGGLTLAVNGGTPFSVTWEDQNSFTAGQWPAHDIGEGIYDGTTLRMHGPIGPSLFVTMNENTVYEGTDSGSADNIQINNIAPAISAYATGQIYAVTIQANNTTTTPQMQIGSLGQLQIRRADGSQCAANDLQAGGVTWLANVGSYVQLMGVYQNFLPSSRAQAFLSSGTFTPPTGVYKVKRVRCWGAGGGGGGASGTSQSAFGGGGAGYTEAYNITVIPGTPITVTVGAGGNAGVGATAGTAGGTSTFGSSSPVASTGGTGGDWSGGSSQGVGGTGSGGAITASGHYGSFPVYVGSTPGSGVGGEAPFASGIFSLQFASASALTASWGLSPGGGGNSGVTGTSGGTATGGPGSAGLIIIEY